MRGDAKITKRSPRLYITSNGTNICDPEYVSKDVTISNLANAIYNTGITT